ENIFFEVITPEKEKVEKVDVQKELENEIKRLLVLHGHRKEEFVEWVTSEKNDKAYEVEYQELRVFEKIYLELQDDETHFASPEFRNIFHELINQFVQNPNVQAASFVNDLPPEIAGEVSGILMDEERLYMHDWQRKDIFVKDKNQNIGALVMETLVSLRWHLLSKQIAKLSLEVQNEKDDDDNIEILQEVSGLWGLKQLCAEKLGPVI